MTSILRISGGELRQCRGIIDHVECEKMRLIFVSSVEENFADALVKMEEPSLSLLLLFFFDRLTEGAFTRGFVPARERGSELLLAEDATELGGG